ncbi:hypothetical protein DERF_002691 [Dermatophagoides farinae]|uniref:Reverse transcriptase domain-containing protein n=1 Tax=Dermatophagoides farinae TaxID=6954 RepID=A0A922LC61_DERFA|nr:hypothetical protein DERF_002691 [Dermatophagoides farinae]
MPRFAQGGSRKQPRPSWLISVLGKLLDRIMSIRITNHLINNGHMSHHQYGFMAGKSTDHALLNLHMTSTQQFQNSNMYA